MPLYESLGVSPALVVDAPRRDGDTSSKALWSRAETLKKSRTASQGAWVSFVQDMLPYLQPD